MRIGIFSIMCHDFSISRGPQKKSLLNARFSDQLKKAPLLETSIPSKGYARYMQIISVNFVSFLTQELRLQIRSFDDFVYSLNNQGFLLKKGPRVYQLQTSSCL